MTAHKRTPKDTFTAREVAALIESLRKDIQLIAEGVVDIRKEVDGLKAWREEMSTWRLDATSKLGGMVSELRAIRTDLTAFNTRLKVVEEKLGVQ